MCYYQKVYEMFNFSKASSTLWVVVVVVVVVVIILAILDVCSDISSRFLLTIP